MSVFFATLAIVLAGVFVLRIRSKESQANCHICERPVSEPIYHDGYPFCVVHGDDYSKGHWIVLIKGHSTPEDPEFGVRLYHLKQELATHDLSSYIQVRYENLEDEIITFMELCVLEECSERARTLSKQFFA